MGLAYSDPEDLVSGEGAILAHYWIVVDLSYGAEFVSLAGGCQNWNC